MRNRDDAERLRRYIEDRSPYRIKKEQGTQYVLQKYLGSGSFGVVYKGGNYAIKLVLLTEDRKENELLAREIQNMFKIKHENVVRLYDVFEQTFKIQQSYQCYSYKCQCFVMECCSTDLTHVLKRYKFMEENQAIQMMRAMLNGFIQLYVRNIIHRDLKPDNILIDGHGNPKIADFGLSKSRKYDIVEYKTFAGTPYYMSPQATSLQPYSSKVDVWSFGIIYYEMLHGCGKFPWKNSNQQKLFLKQRDHRNLFFENHVSQYTRDLIEKMLAVDQSQRISFEELFYQFKLQKEVQKSMKKLKQQVKMQQQLKIKMKYQADDAKKQGMQKQIKQRQFDKQNYSPNSQRTNKNHRSKKKLNQIDINEPIKRAKSNPKQRNYDEQFKIRQQFKINQRKYSTISINFEDIFKIIALHGIQFMNENICEWCKKYQSYDQLPVRQIKILEQILSFFNKNFQYIGKQAVKKKLNRGTK